MKGQGYNKNMSMFTMTSVVEKLSVFERTIFTSHCWLALCGREKWHMIALLQTLS